MRDRPSEPLLLINSDDNILDLYFKEERVNGKGHKTTNDYYRPALYIVVDAYNDYVLGYAIGDTVTIDLIKAAYLNAINHVKELTGDTYLWHQIQTDRWAIGKNSALEQFFTAQAHFTPATAKVAQAKYIERTFGINWHQTLKMFPNYAGQNIGAKENLNPDAVQKAKKDYPYKDEVPQYVAKLIDMIRQSVNPKSGLPRQNDWLKAFETATKGKQKQITEEKRLQLFGVTHPNERKITASGIEVEINRQRLYYEVPNELYLENVNKKVQITYDPTDMRQVLISDGKELRFMANEYVKMPSALADHTPDTMKRLKAELEIKKQIMATIGNATQHRADVLDRHSIDAASLLQAGVITKEINHAAQRVLAGYTAITPSKSPPVGETFENEALDYRQFM